MALAAIIIGGGSSVFTASTLTGEAHQEMRLLTEKVSHLQSTVAALNQEVDSLRQFIDFRLSAIEQNVQRLERGGKTLPFDNLKLDPEESPVYSGPG